MEKIICDGCGKDITNEKIRKIGLSRLGKVDEIQEWITFDLCTSKNCLEIAFQKAKEEVDRWWE